MKAAVIKRKYGYDIFFIDNKKEIVDIYGVDGIEIYNTLDDFVLSLKLKEKKIEEIEKIIEEDSA